MTFKRATRSQRVRRRRHGAAVVELAVVMPVILLFLLGTIDFSLIMYAYGTVSEAARGGARYAIVHGSWSSVPVGPAANDATVATTVKSFAPALDPTQLTITSSWANNSNAPSSQVTVNVSYNCPMSILRAIGFTTFKVTGATTMTITH
jgi:Flp pilus assembly protein TadG